MSAIAPAPIQCIERESLVAQLRAVMDELLLIEDEEVKVVARGDFTMGDSLRNQFRRTHEHRELLMERLRLHVADHGCSIRPLAGARCISTAC